jgi:hypothetical protein
VVSGSESKNQSEFGAIDPELLHEISFVIGKRDASQEDEIFGDVMNPREFAAWLITRICAFYTSHSKSPKADR